MATLRAVFLACKDSYGLLIGEPRSMPRGWTQVIPATRRNQPITSSGHSGVAYYNKESKELIIAHRGSRLTLKDWANNLKIPFVQSNAPAQDAIKFSQEVIRTLRRQVPAAEISHVYQTGHSKGGYEAQICTAQMAAKEPVYPITCLAINAPQIKTSMVRPPPRFEALHIHGNKDVVHTTGPLRQGQHLGNSAVVETRPSWFRAMSNHALGSIENGIKKFEKMEVGDLIKASRRVENGSLLEIVAVAHVPPQPTVAPPAPYASYGADLQTYRDRQKNYEALPGGVKNGANKTFGSVFGGVVTVDDLRRRFAANNPGTAGSDPYREQIDVKKAFNERQQSLEDQARAPAMSQFDQDRLRKISQFEKADYAFEENKSSNPTILHSQKQDREQALDALARHDTSIGGPNKQVGDAQRKDWVMSRDGDVLPTEARRRREVDDFMTARAAERGDAPQQAEAPQHTIALAKDHEVALGQADAATKPFVPRSEIDVKSRIIAMRKKPDVTDEHERRGVLETAELASLASGAETPADPEPASKMAEATLVSAATEALMPKRGVPKLEAPPVGDAIQTAEVVEPVQKPATTQAVPVEGVAPEDEVAQAEEGISGDRAPVDRAPVDRISENIMAEKPTSPAIQNSQSTDGELGTKSAASMPETQPSNEPPNHLPPRFDHNQVAPEASSTLALRPAENQGTSPYKLPPRFDQNQDHDQPGCDVNPTPGKASDPALQEVKQGKQKEQALPPRFDASTAEPEAQSRQLRPSEPGPDV